MQVITSLLLCSQFIAPYLPQCTYSTFHKPKPFPSVNINNFSTELAKLKSNSSVPITTTSPIIAQAIKDLKSVPGFWPTLVTYIDNQNKPHVIKGTLFEIEVALKLKNCLVAMNIYCRHKELCRQFDIIFNNDTNNATFGECKDINWEKAHYYADTREKLKQQFLDQQKLVAMLNKFYGSRNEYQLFSKNQLCPTWKLWLNNHAITYEEA